MRVARGNRSFTCALTFLACAIGPVTPLSAQDGAEVPEDPAAFRQWASEYAGAYRFGPDRHLIVVPHTSLRMLSMFELETGIARPLAPASEAEDGDAADTGAGDAGGSVETFVYGPNVTAVEPVEGRLAFLRDADGRIERLRWQVSDEPVDGAIGRRVPLRRQSVRFTNGDEAELAGWLITPPTEGPHPVAVILQPGANDRFKMWRTAMALSVDGIGVLVFDRRGVGESTGAELPSHYWSMTHELAGDAAEAVRFTRAHPRVDADRVGVVGWSQGGWMGALVAARVPELVFYVNIAGNSNPGWQQNRWNKLSSMHWEGFDEEAVTEADEFLDLHFGVMLGETTWETYRDAVEELGDRSWFEWMEKTFRYLWKSEAEAREYAELNRDNVPERDFARVSAPTLGLFFEHDESSPPETPWIFLRGRLSGPDPDVTVRVIPNTTHEAFVVRRFPTAAGQSEIDRLAPELFDELRRWVADRVRDEES